MSEAILIGVLSSASALLGVLISQAYESRKRASEETRWYAEFFLGRKIDALHALYGALVDCHFVMNFYGNSPPSTLEEFKVKVNPKEEAYLRAKVMASLYLDHESEMIMSKALGAFRQASMAIWFGLPDDQLPVGKDTYNDEVKQFDWKGFNESYDCAVSCLKNMLNPETLRNLDIDIRN